MTPATMIKTTFLMALHAPLEPPQRVSRRGTYEVSGIKNRRITVRTEFGERSDQLGYASPLVRARSIAEDLARSNRGGIAS